MAIATLNAQTRIGSWLLGSVFVCEWFVGSDRRGKGGVLRSFEVWSKAEYANVALCMVYGRLNPLSCASELSQIRA